jgi:hypothetical protein
MKISYRQQIAGKFINPFGSVQTLTFRAMPVAAGIVRNANVSALIAGIGMAAHGRCAAVLYGKHRFAIM